jgi:hypothetical protein
MANEGALDRLLRLMLAIILVIVGWGMSGIVGTILLVVSLVLFVTTAVGICPLYSLLGINTLQNKADATE